MELENLHEVLRMCWSAQVQLESSRDVLACSTVAKLGDAPPGQVAERGDGFRPRGRFDICLAENHMGPTRKLGR